MSDLLRDRIDTGDGVIYRVVHDGDLAVYMQSVEIDGLRRVTGLGVCRYTRKVGEDARECRWFGRCTDVDAMGRVATQDMHRAAIECRWDDAPLFDRLAELHAAEVAS